MTSVASWQLATQLQLPGQDCLKANQNHECSCHNLHLSIVWYWWIWSFEWIFINLKVQHSHSRHQKTTSDLLRTTLKGTLRFSNEWPLERALYMCINHIMVKLLWATGHPEFFPPSNFSKILMVSDKAIHKAFRIHKTKCYKTHFNREIL